MQVSAYTGAEELAGALKGTDLVIIPAGVPRKPGMTRDDLFNTNAGACALHKPPDSERPVRVIRIQTTGMKQYVHVRVCRCVCMYRYRQEPY